jgi:N-acetylglucosamine-6-phosphate deacetylase
MNTDAKPTFFDLQVNGYGGIDFNQDDLTEQQLLTACQRLAADGVAGFLATIVTDAMDRMLTRLRNLAALRERHDVCRELIRGIHIEGPFLSPTTGYRGAHPLDAIRPASESDMDKLLDAAGGLTKLVTLAPEHDEQLRVTRKLARGGISISAGHCDPTLDQLKEAIDAGVSMFTHLGNGCPMQMHRHDNIVQRALSLHERLWLCFIADGVHVPLPALGNYLRSISLDRAVVVTDAIAPAGLGPGRYTLGRWDLLIGDDMVARAPDGSHFVGSGITMPQTLANLENGLGLARADALRLVTTNPMRAIGLA